MTNTSMRDGIAMQERIRLTVENKALRAAICRLLDVYWEGGDGAPPPVFVAEAARLSGWIWKGRPA